MSSIFAKLVAIAHLRGLFSFSFLDCLLILIIFLHHLLILFGESLLIPLAEQLRSLHGLLHLFQVLIHVIHVVTKSFLSSDSCSYVLKLLLNHLFWLTVEKVI